MIFGLTISMLGNKGFDFSNIGLPEAASSLAVVMLSMVGALVLFMVTGKAISNLPFFNRMVLKTSMSSGEGYVSAETAIKHLTGKSGTTINTLRPAGKVNIDDNIYNAQALSSFIEAGKVVVVVKVEMGHLFVREER